MTNDEAIRILGNAAAQYRGTLDDHQALQQALQVVSTALSAKPKIAVPEGSSKAGK